MQAHKGSGEKYRSALRSRVFNLRDKKNQALRENVLTGVVEPDKFAVSERFSFRPLTFGPVTFDPQSLIRVSNEYLS